MVHISFNTEELTPTETKALVKLLEELAKPTVKMESMDTGAAVEAAMEKLRDTYNPENGAATTNYREETGRAKRGRPKKEEAAPAEPLPQPVMEAVAENICAAFDEGASVPAPTLDELRAALQAFAVKFGMAEGTALLQKYGVARVSEIMNLEVVKQHEFVVACNA